MKLLKKNCKIRVKKNDKIRTMSSHDLRILCIENDWYSYGSCYEYEKLLTKPIEENITAEKLIEIANDIFLHSKNVYWIDIFSDLLHICSTSSKRERVEK